MNLKEEEIKILNIRFKKFEDWLNDINIELSYPKSSNMKKWIDKYYKVKNQGIDLRNSGKISKALNKYRKARNKAGDILYFFSKNTDIEIPFETYCASGNGTSSDPYITINWILFAAGFSFNNHENEIYRNNDFRFLEIQIWDCKNITFDNCKFTGIGLIEMTNLFINNCTFDEELYISKCHDVKIENCVIKHLTLKSTKNLLFEKCAIEKKHIEQCENISL